MSPSTGSMQWHYWQTAGKGLTKDDFHDINRKVPNIRTKDISDSRLWDIPINQATGHASTQLLYPWFSTYSTKIKHVCYSCLESDRHCIPIRTYIWTILKQFYRSNYNHNHNIKISLDKCFDGTFHKLLSYHMPGMSIMRMYLNLCLMSAYITRCK